jgi:hypothetical protein
MSSLALGPTQPPIQQVIGFFSHGESDWGVMLIAHLHLVPRLSVSEATAVPHMASCHLTAKFGCRSIWAQAAGFWNACLKGLLKCKNPIRSFFPFFFFFFGGGVLYIKLSSAYTQIQYVIKHHPAWQWEGLLNTTTPMGRTFTFTNA